MCVWGGVSAAPGPPAADMQEIWRGGDQGGWFPRRRLRRLARRCGEGAFLPLSEGISVGGERLEGGGGDSHRYCVRVGA
jgi:hypothetical protein